MGSERAEQFKYIALLCLVTGASVLVFLSLVTNTSFSRKAPERHQKNSKLKSQTTKPIELPFGGRTLLPNYRFVALYGTPTYPVLGALGEQDIATSISRSQQLAAEYQPLSTEKIIPTFEIITTVASASATVNGDYSNELEIAKLQPWIDAARAAGVYVLLDLQPGRTSFSDQAKLYESLLKEPHVGLALDPEWRLAPDQVHLVQIGRVSIEEVNQTATWLADLTKQNKLPQKMLLLHQFRLSMIQNRELLDTSRPELAFVIQMDGQGAQNVKDDTWRVITAAPPANTSFGWKNFYKKDIGVRSPTDTMAITPKPVYISYQ